MKSEEYCVFCFCIFKLFNVPCRFKRNNYSVASHCFVSIRLISYNVLVLFHEAGTVLYKYINERINKSNINTEAPVVKDLSCWKKLPSVSSVKIRSLLKITRKQVFPCALSAPSLSNLLQTESVF